MWVRPADEAEVREAFEQAVTVRVLSPDARRLADRSFFETVVRVHRAGEGAPYTGLKPAGRDLGPAIPAADRALEQGVVAPLAHLLVDTLERGLHERVDAALQAKRAATLEDVEAGRHYVEAYVTFIHYVERLYEAAGSAPHGHYPDETHIEGADH